MTVKLAGRDDVAASTANGSNNILMTKYTASATGGATEIKLRVMASVAGNVTIGIYADSAGAPAALLGTSSSTAVSSGAEREITIALLAEVQITSGTAYWVAFNSSANIVAAKSEVAVRKYKGAAYGALPDPAGAGYTDETTYTDVTSIWGHTDATVSAVLITATATVLVPSLQADSNVAGVVLTASMETLSPAISLSLDAPTLTATGETNVPVIMADSVVAAILLTATADTIAPSILVSMGIPCLSATAAMLVPTLIKIMPLRTKVNANPNRIITLSEKPHREINVNSNPYRTVIVRSLPSEAI